MKLLQSRRQDLVGLAVLIVLLVVFPLLAPVSWVNVGVYALIYSIAAIGLTLLMGLAGQVSLGQAAFFAIGAYAQAILVTRYAWSGLLAALTAVVVASVAALLLGLVLLRLRGHYLALATLGLGIIITVLANESSFTGGTSGIFGIPKPQFGGRIYDSANEFFWLLVPFVVLALLVARNISASRTGRALSAVNDSEVAAETLGVDTFRLRLKVFVLSAAYAAGAGVFFAHWLAVVNSNTAHFSLSVKFLLMSVLGGLASVWGAVIGGFLVEFLDEGMKTLIPQLVPGATGEVQLIGFGLVLVLLVILLPGGLHQAATVAWRALRPSRETGRQRATVRGTARGAARGTGAARGGPADPSGGASPDGASADHAGDHAAGHAAAQTPSEAPLFEREGRPAAGTTLLEVNGLTKRFGGVLAVDDVAFHAGAGEIVALIGPNGAGKTTCFNMISGVLSPTSGSVTVAGQRTEGHRPHVFAEARATRTFQNLQVFGSTTVLGNVMVGRHLRSRAGMLSSALVAPAHAEEQDIERAAHEILELVGLADVAHRPARDLPFGRQRLVEVARALALEPDLLLLDEPMAGLSGAERRALARLLRRLRAGGMGIVLVEHDMEAVLSLADRVVVLDDGRLIAVGTPAEIRSDPVVIAAYLGVEEDQVEAETRGLDV